MPLRGNGNEKNLLIAASYLLLAVRARKEGVVVDVLEVLDRPCGAVLEGLGLRDGMQYRLYGWEHGVVWSNGSGEPNETRARHGILVQHTGLLISQKAQTIIPLAQADSVLRTCLRFSSPQSQYHSRGRGARVPNIAWSNEPSGSDDTRACRLHNHSMVKRVLRPERHEGGAAPQSQYGEGIVDNRGI